MSGCSGCEPAPASVQRPPKFGSSCAGVTPTTSAVRRAPHMAEVMLIRHRARSFSRLGSGVVAPNRCGASVTSVPPHFVWPVWSNYFHPSSRARRRAGADHSLRVPLVPPAPLPLVTRELRTSGMRKYETDAAVQGCWRVAAASAVESTRGTFASEIKSYTTGDRRSEDQEL